MEPTVFTNVQMRGALLQKLSSYVHKLSLISSVYEKKTPRANYSSSIK